MWYFGVPKISKNQLLTCLFSNFSAEEGPGILVRGLYIVGAEWDADKLVLKDAGRESIFQQMPVIRLVPVHNGNCIIYNNIYYILINNIYLFYTAVHVPGNIK